MFVVTEPRVKKFLNKLSDVLETEHSIQRVWERGWGYEYEDPTFWTYHFTSLALTADHILEIKLLFRDGKRGYLLEGFRFGVWNTVSGDYDSVTDYEFRDISTVEDFKIAFECCFESSNTLSRKVA
ncbi:hypothetical protein [Yersinia ruckeri]|uniref:hypothetical protein n=1 Tax=Yersinia ruckeri TaxID=29486 RepID=UPI002238099C|nr:hypothetical protein [Yersinia ruckeri]MCW6598836.1 hypothetical protein [Yersinia ruckeri]